MLAFIQRYISGISRNLQDPNTSVRYPARDRIDDLAALDQQIFDDLLGVTGQESSLGYTETTITFKNGVSYYRLPEGFRNFLGLENRLQDSVLSHFRSKTFYSPRYAPEIITASRGFRLFPPPTLKVDDDWVLQYRRAPGILHYAKAASVTNNSLVSGPPGADAGEIILTNGYYKGMELHVFQAESGSHQQREILDFKVSTGGDKGTFVLRHEWDPIPTGEIWYEVTPTLPFPYDDIYAMDASLPELRRRKQFLQADQLQKDRDKQWRAARKYFSSNVSDRGPTRNKPLRPEDYMPSGDLGSVYY